MVSRTKCCVPSCTTNYNQDIPLHYFPNPDTDLQMFTIWVSAIGGDIVNLDSNVLYKRGRICHLHFETKYHYSKGKLNRRVAVPTLRVAQPLTEAESLESALIPNLNEMLNMVQPGPSNVSACCSSSSKPRRKFKKENEELLKHFKKTHAAITKIMGEKNHFKKQLQLAKKLQRQKAFEIITKDMKAVTKKFLSMQMSQAKKQPKGRRFTMDQKILALSLYKLSPKAYRIYSQICLLPKRSTLQKLTRRIDLKPGINEIIFETLKKKVEKMPVHHRYCTLLFDEMSISPSLKFEQHKGYISGFTDDGFTQNINFANHVLVMMIRGVIKKFKQPIFYSFCSGTTKTIDLVRILKEVILKIQSTGLELVATICDQGATNMAAINYLLGNTKADYLRNNVEWRGGFFELNDKKIFTLYDAPHLLKGIRNNLLNKDLMFEQDDKVKLAKWKYIEDAFKRSPSYKGMKLVKKLTAQHVIPKLIPKMKVKNCTQVFSNSVGVTIGFLADAGVIPKESQDTADLLLFFDDLFDSVNGHYSKIQNGKKFRAAVTPRSPHHLLWSKSLPILKSMKFIDSNNKCTQVPSVKSWVKTIEGFQLLTKHLFSLGENSLLLRHFNQDPLENFFGGIRSQGNCNRMPIASHFEGAYKAMLLNNLTATHSIGFNCEKDDNISLETFKFLLNKPTNLKENQIYEIDPEHLNLNLIDSELLIQSKKKEDLEKCAAVGYCSGWLVKVIKKNLVKTCKLCSDCLESKEILPFHKFIQISEYENKSWLRYPTRDLFDAFLNIERIILKILEKKCATKTLIDYTYKSNNKCARKF